MLSKSLLNLEISIWNRWKLTWLNPSSKECNPHFPLKNKSNKWTQTFTAKRLSRISPNWLTCIRMEQSKQHGWSHKCQLREKFLSISHITWTCKFTFLRIRYPSFLAPNHSLAYLFFFIASIPIWNFITFFPPTLSSLFEWNLCEGTNYVTMVTAVIIAPRIGPSA